jgi:pimeloyl-ACP methyl ester carboxylesterase
MRLFETIQLAVVAAAVFLPVVFSRRLRRGRMAVVLLLAALVQLVAEGFRWQLVPLEVGTVALAVGDALWDDRRVRGLRRFRRGLLGTIGLAAVAFLPWALPVPELPEPAGRFEIGTATFELVDPERAEGYGLPEVEAEADPEPEVQSGAEDEDQEEPTGPPRRVVVQVWYPAVPADDAQRVPWTPDMDVVGPAMSEHLGFPGFFLDHTADIPSHSVADAPPLDGRFPVVLSSHGWSGFRTINLPQIESLASRGFMVIAPDHPFGAVATRFPSDGSVARLDPRALPDEADVGEAAYAEAAELLVETFSEDLILVLDQLEVGDEGAFGALAAHADVEHVGVFGHSTGGGAAVRTCLVDARCDAVAGLDAWVEPISDRTVATELQIPSLFVRSEEWRGTQNDRRLRGQAERSPSESYWVAIEGAGHNDFVAAPLLSPIGDRFGLTGPIPADRVIPIVDGYLVSFFERYLLGVGGTALDQPPPSEVEFEYIP